MSESKLKELQDKIRIAEQRLTDLAQVNVQYNAEISRLKSAKEEIELATVRANTDYQEVVRSLEQAKTRLSVTVSKLNEKKTELDSMTIQNNIMLSDSTKELDKVKRDIKELSDKKALLADEVSRLEKQRFDLGVQVNTSKVTAEENARRMKTASAKMAQADAELAQAHDRLSKYVSMMEEKQEALKASVAMLIENECQLVRSIQQNRNILESLDRELANKKAKQQEELKARIDELAVKEKAVADAREKNGRDSADIARQRDGLIAREKELKLVELKLRDLARKKDLDLQIAEYQK